MIEYRCPTHGVLATENKEAPDKCPTCNGRVWRWIADGDSFKADPVQSWD
jgi:hypothetical protein